MDTSTTTQVAEILVQYGRPVVPLERNLCGHPLARLSWERQFEEVLLELRWEKVPNWECLFVHRKQGFFLFGYTDDVKLGSKKQNIDPMWKVLTMFIQGALNKHR